MSRINYNMIEQKIIYLNHLTNNPMNAWTKLEVGKGLKANIGNFHLYECLGIVALDQHMNEGGGVHRVLTGTTKRELYDQLCAFINGLNNASSHSNIIRNGVQS